MEQDVKQCPYCGETIKVSAKKCKFCGRWLTPEASDIKQVHRSTQEDNDEDSQMDDSTNHVKSVNVIGGLLDVLPLVDAVVYICRVLFIFDFVWLLSNNGKFSPLHIGDIPFEFMRIINDIFGAILCACMCLILYCVLRYNNNFEDKLKVKYISYMFASQVAMTVITVLILFDDVVTLNVIGAVILIVNIVLSIMLSRDIKLKWGKSASSPFKFYGWGMVIAILTPIISMLFGMYEDNSMMLGEIVSVVVYMIFLSKDKQFGCQKIWSDEYAKRQKDEMFRSIVRGE